MSQKATEADILNLLFENDRLRAQNAKLIEALRPFAEIVKSKRFGGTIEVTFRVLKEIEDGK